jgi:phosphorylcholine metabolism protein LicD
MKLLIAAIMIIVLTIIIIIMSYKIVSRKEQYSLPATHIILKDYMKKFHQICKDNNITYWADGGTLLGAVRHTGIIPHDDDIDIVMFEEDFERLKKVLSEQENEYYVKHFEFPLWKFLKRGIDAAWIDIFLIVKEEDKYVFKEIKHREFWPTMWYKHTEIFPLKEVDFEDVKIFIPNDPIPYLERGYGSDWKIPKISGRHN